MSACEQGRHRASSISLAADGHEGTHTVQSAALMSQ